MFVLSLKDVCLYSGYKLADTSSKLEKLTGVEAELSVARVATGGVVVLLG
jgi:hypothetical protein